MIDHCVSALRQYRQHETIMNYIADGLYAMINGGLTYTSRLTDLLHPKTEEELKKQDEDNKKEAKRIQNRLKDKLRGGKST